MALNKLVVRITDSGEGPVFDRFFAGYDRAFVLPDEKEDREGFATCLTLNHGAARTDLERRYGRFREVCMIAEEADGSPVGGANFIALKSEAGEPAAGGGFGTVTVNLNYVYVDGQSRGRGNLRRLVGAVAEIAAAMFSDGSAPAPALVFIELNDPFAMSEEAYRRDTEFTGLDQLDRLRIWTRLGARIVDHDYVQPALSAEQEPDHSLIYAVIGGDATMSACLLLGHLRGFFGISVLKGRPLSDDPSARAQIALLEAACAAGKLIELLDAGPLVARLAAKAGAATSLGALPRTTREAIRLQAGLTT